MTREDAEREADGRYRAYRRRGMALVVEGEPKPFRVGYSDCIGGLVRLVQTGRGDSWGEAFAEADAKAEGKGNG